MKLDSLIFNVTQMQLAKTSRTISRSLERISSGNRLQRPADDIASFSLFARLQSSIREKTQRINNLNQETSLLNVAQTSIQSQIEITQRLREVFVEAEAGGLSTEQRQDLQKEVKSLLEEFNRIAQETNFNGQTLFTGGKKLGEFQLPNLSAAETFKKAYGNFNFTTSSVSSVYSSDSILQDVNTDGIDDLLAIDGTNFSVLIGDGKGNFSIRAQYATTATDLTIGDFNSDGHMDVGYASSLEGYFSIQLSNGDGTFRARTTVASAGAVSLETADFDEDGILDIATRTGPTGTSTVVVFKGDGAGSFSSIATFNAGTTVSSSPNLVTLGDLNGDGHIDIVTNDYIDSKVSVFLGNGDGSFQARVSYSTTTNIISQTLGDIDKDGDLDLILGASGAARYMLNDGNGAFGAATLIASPPTLVQSVQFVDLDNDGVEEIVAGSYVYKETSSLSYVLAANTAMFGRFAIGDINGDGTVDLLNGYTKRVSNPVYKSALSELSVLETADSETSLKIIDGALSKLEENLFKLTNEQQRRLHEIDSEFLTKQSLEEARDSVGEVDFILEIANVLAEQIKQQAQIAVLAQANTQRKIVLSLLSNLR